MSDEKIYKLLKLLMYLVGHMPVWLADFCAHGLGLLWYGLDKRHRTVTLNNLQQAFEGRMSPSEARQVGKQVFKNIANILFEVAWSCRLDKQTLLSHFTIKGIEHVKKAHDKGRGVIVVTCHMGNFELLITAIEETGLPGYAIYRKLDFKPLERLILDIRQRFGVTMIPIRGASKKIDAILRAGGVVGTLLDQNVDWYQGVFVDFFGRPACTNSGLAALAIRTKAPVLPMYTMRKNREFLIEFLPEIPLEDTGDRIKDLENNTQNYTAAIEAMVRRYPDQYFWVHNRWKTKSYCMLPQS